MTWTRRALPLLFLSFGLFLLGCAEKLDEPLSTEYSTMIGEVKSLGGIHVNKNITHLFQDENGEIYYAYSSRYDLDESSKKGDTFEIYGSVSEYENIDKPVLEIRRLSEAPEEVLEAKNETWMDYSSSQFGFSLKYHSDWALEESAETVSWNKPHEDGLASVIQVLIHPDSLTTLGSDEAAVREADLRRALNALYPSEFDEAELNQIGADQQMALHSVSPAKNEFYFMARDSDLYELYFMPNTSDPLELASLSSQFNEMVNSFRFGTKSVEADVTEPAESAEVEDYRTFESTPFHFSILYPEDWYFSGGMGGYDFAQDPIEDGSPILIRLDINVRNSEGESYSNGQASLTKKIGDTHYTLSAQPEYKSVLQTMIDSIKPF
jgi:hypothetical protein